MAGVVDIARFKIDLKRAINALLPYAREHKMNPQKWQNEFVEHKGQINPRRVFLFDGYRLILTMEEVGIVIASISVLGRHLTDDETAAFRETVQETLPDLYVHNMDGIALPGSSAFKVIGVPLDRYREKEPTP